jgi:hypothetical protein
MISAISLSYYLNVKLEVCFRTLKPLLLILCFQLFLPRSDQKAPDRRKRHDHCQG